MTNYRIDSLLALRNTLVRRLPVSPKALKIVRVDSVCIGVDANERVYSNIDRRSLPISCMYESKRTAIIIGLIKLRLLNPAVLKDIDGDKAIRRRMQEAGYLLSLKDRFKDIDAPLTVGQMKKLAKVAAGVTARG